MKKNARRIIVVKRRGIREPFDERKAYASCYAACLNVAMDKRRAEELSEKVTVELQRWLRGKNPVDSQELFDRLVRIIAKHDKDVAFMYETHRDIS